MELTKALTADGIDHIIIEGMRNHINADYTPEEVQEAAKVILAWYTPFTQEEGS